VRVVLRDINIKSKGLQREKKFQEMRKEIKNHAAKKVSENCQKKLLSPSN
jgi:hypothetical protein